MRGLAYEKFEAGHRRSYLEIWAGEFGFDILIAYPNIGVFWRLLRAPRVIFSTLDDVPFLFLLVGLARALVGRKTVGIFLRPYACYHSHHWKYRLKWLYFRMLTFIPPIAPVSIIPYFVNPRFNEVSRDWIYDPQNWDLVGATPDLTQRTGLVDRLVAHANGRKIIVAIGGLNRFKGFDYLGEVVASGRIDPATHVVMACGPLSEESIAAAEAITRSGGLVINKFISDDDIMAIYGVAHYVWACYPVANDQASGIFGRASQLGVPAIVRAKSFNALQAERMGVPHLAVPIDSPIEAARMIGMTSIGRKSPDQRMIEGFRSESLARLQALL